MHTIYTTQAFVLSNRLSGEANGIISLFTKDFGLIQVVAQGIRSPKSKLAGHVRPFSFGEYSLVRGKEMWRLVGAEAAFCLDDTHRKEPLLRCFARIFRLIKRLVHGEERNHHIYETIEVSADFVRKSGEVEEKVLESFEVVMAFQILFALGYIADNPQLAEFFKKSVISKDGLDLAQAKYALLLKEVNHALQISQL